MTLLGSFPILLPGPPPPPPHIRVNKKDVLISKSSINFTFNCSWFSDANGAVKYFTVVVREADGKWSWINSKTQDYFLESQLWGLLLWQVFKRRKLNFYIISLYLCWLQWDVTKKENLLEAYYLQDLIIKWVIIATISIITITIIYLLLLPALLEMHCVCWLIQSLLLIQSHSAPLFCH